jgi:hypothetical protein
MKKAISILLAVSLLLSLTISVHAISNTSQGIALTIPRESEEFLTSAVNPVVYFYAEFGFDVPHLTLINAETNQPVATMLDDGRFSVSGDDVQGDSVYSCKIAIDVSQAGEFSYYAVFERDGVTVTSNTVTIRVFAAFTQQDHDNIETVYNRVDRLMDSAEFRAMSTDGKAQALASLLYELETAGLIHSIILGSELHSFTHTSGLVSAVVFAPRDPMINGVPNGNDGGVTTAVPPTTTEPPIRNPRLPINAPCQCPECNGIISSVVNGICSDCENFLVSGCVENMCVQYSCSCRSNNDTRNEPSTTTEPTIATTPPNTGGIFPPDNSAVSDNGNNCGSAVTNDETTKIMPVRMGAIIDGENVTIGDALEVLKYLVGLQNVISSNGRDSRQWNAALITGGDTPMIGDALEILKHIAGMESMLGRKN